MIFRIKISTHALISLLIILILCLSSIQVLGQISVKFWANDSKSAFTFSFDDNCMSQYTYGAPLLDSFKFKGTFAVITDSMTDDLPGIARYGTWNQFRSMSLEGHEIGSHSVTHPDLTTLATGDTSTKGTLLYELYQSQKVINQKIPNQRCIVMVYPNLAYNLNVEVQTSNFYASGRTGGTSPVDGSLANLDYYRIVSNEALFNLPRNSPSDDLDELAQMETYADSCVKVGDWGLLELHEIVPFSQIPQLVINNEWFPTSTEWLTSFCQHIKQKSDSNLVWVETMGNITRYMRERQDFMWDILSQTDTQMQIHGYDTLDDQIYNYPLTVDINVPANWVGAIFSQGARSDTLYTLTTAGNTYVRTHFIPDGGTVILNRIIPVLTITSPNGGENWRVGGVDTVKWTSSNVTYAKIELTTNNGTSWSKIKDSVSASVRCYAWTIPDSISTQCKVRLTDIADTSIKSISAATFTISPIPVIAITSPNGGENWRVGGIDTVKWTSSNLRYAKIELTTNNGISWSTIKDSASASRGRYAWTIPDSISTQCKVRLTDVADTSIKSISAATFTISPIPVIAITSPNGGETWRVGGIDTVKWTSSNITYAKIELTTNNGTSWSTIKDSASASVRCYVWMIPDSISTQCKVKLTDIADTSIKSMSAATFTISPIPVITITSPNGGETWRVGGIDTVKWTSSNITYAKIELTTNNGTAWSTIKDSASASVRCYAWRIPNSPSTQCKVRLTDIADTSIRSICGNTFTIEQVPVLTLSVLIEGLYNGNSMKADTVAVELRNSISPFVLVDSIKRVIDTAGAGTFTFSNAVNGTPYFIVVKHRNALETWSAAAHSFTSSILSYDFTTAQSQAYGNNLILKNSKYCIYSGDVNQDGLVDLTDLIAIDNDNANYVTGFALTDINGDGLVDLSDLILADNNNMNYVAKSAPPVN
jgi:peptidoglycan/xylan/chitin deacetylase (PgdA/CDA1 family)/predicted 3-demethylubiquinone-9 3-methyltransferase (glyoxalase superfamily)